MSKLASKMAAKRAAKAAGIPETPSPEPLQAKTTEQPDNDVPHYATSGIALGALFPLVQSCRNLVPPPPEPHHATTTIVAPPPPGWNEGAGSPNVMHVPGGSPFDPWSRSDARLQAFLGPSPDDAVLNARAGTRLAG